MKMGPQFLWILFFATGCIDPFAVQITEQPEQYVVYGRITDQEPPYKVVISKTSNYSRNIDGFTQYISEATVQVCDNLGNCIPFFEMAKGQYETTLQAPRGIVGRFYHVEIVTKEGARIESKEEELIASPPITAVYYEYDINSVQLDGFQAYLDTNDPANEKNYYKWETTSYYPYSTQCFYKIEGASYPLIASDQNTNGNSLSRVFLRDVTFNRRDYFVVEAHQFALSQEAYQFWNEIKKQVDATGSIFDPPPSYIRGNLFHPDDEGKNVLGYFMVAGVSVKGVAIDRAVGELTPIPQSKELVPAPCYCGIPCPGSCGPFNPCKCGDPPCPPECSLVPGVTSVAPKDWPLPHDPC